MRDYFNEQLQRLRTQMISMGCLCEKAISDATKALTEGDVELAQQVINGDERINQQERDIEELCIKLLLHQNPVAGDMRRISSILKMITDLERIGDQAADIAEIVKAMNHKLPDEFLHICKMGIAAMKMVTNSINAYIEQDLCLAREVIASDDEVDALFLTARSEILQAVRDNHAMGEDILDLFMITKYYERIGDHATNIAEWAEYAISGEKSHLN